MQEVLDAHTVIGLIYEASYKPACWPVALESIAKYTHSSSCALIIQDNELEHVSDAYTYNISAETSARHKSHGVDPNFRIMAENVPLGTAAAIDHIIPDRNELEKIYGDKFNQLLKSAGMYYLGGATLFYDEVRVAAIGLQRTRDMGVWTKSEIAKLNILIPHLQRALNIQKEFTLIRTSIEAFHQELDRLSTGLILFNDKLQPIYINPVARSILKYHPAISLKGNIIHCHEKYQTEKIHSALLSAVASNQYPDRDASSTTLGLKHPQCDSVIPVIISRTQGTLHDFEIAGDHAHAVMCFSDPEKPLPIEANQLVDAYRLTPAEAHVAISIANGTSPAEIARNNNVAISTIRSQLKAIYAKLGVRTQAEVVKVLLSGPFI